MRIGFVIADGTRKDAPIGWSIIKWATGSNVVHAFVVTEDKVWQTSEFAFEKVTLEQRAAISKYILQKRPILQHRVVAYLRSLVITHAKKD